METLFIEETNTVKPITIGITYRPPSGDRLLFKEVDALLQNLPKENLIIAGDFNINLFSSLASEFEEMMFSNNLIPTVSQATHERPGCKPSLIDNILINSTENHILSGVLQSRVSHHFPIFNVFTCPVLNAQANSDKNGFRKNHSTTYLTLDMFDKIFDSKSKGNTPALIFLDIKKAFDTVDHKILIDKLKFYGVDGTVILWVKNYLSDRKQATKFLGEKSIYLSIKFGVPQGSLLGPLLFSIYINDMVNACNLSNPYLFADDGALLFENICRKTYLSIKIEMLTIIKWLSANKLSLNVDKTKLLILDNAKFSVKIKLNNNYAIKECKSFK